MCHSLDVCLDAEWPQKVCFVRHEWRHSDSAVNHWPDEVRALDCFYTIFQLASFKLPLCVYTHSGSLNEANWKIVVIVACPDTTRTGWQMDDQHWTRTAHTPSIASGPSRTGYAIEGAFFISEQLSTDAVSTLRKGRVLIRLWKQHRVQART